MSNMRAAILTALMVVFAGLPAAPSRAGDFAGCHQFSGGDPETVVAACTAVIASGTLGQQELAVAFVSRGAGFRFLHQDDRAFEDFARAITLDPLCMAAYHQRGLLHLDRGETEWARADFGVAARIERSGADYRVEEF